MKTWFIFWVSLVLAGSNPCFSQIDNCSSSAPALTFSGGTACVSGTTFGADNDFSNPSYCTINPTGGAVNRDVWYKFTTPASLGGCWTFNLERGSALGDMMVRVFKTCSTAVGSSYVCSSNNYADVSSTSFNAADWTPNTTYYIQVTVRSSTANAGTFNLCVTQNAPKAFNDACATPMLITPTPQTTGNHTAGCSTTYNPAADANVSPGQLCAITLENISWYSFTAQANGTVVILFESIQCNGAGIAFQMGVFTGTSCTSLNYLGCTTAGGGNVNINITNATAGQQFYIALDGDNGSNCHYRVSGTNIIPLPIKLLSFTAKQISDYVLLEWYTATEMNNEFFTIERSADGINFESIGSRIGAGNSNSVRYYQFIDSKLMLSTTFYRVRQTDFDGKFSYSSVIVLSTKVKKSLLTIYPIPSRELCYLNFESKQNGDAIVSVINVMGQIKLSTKLGLKEGLNDLSLNIEDLDSGIYFVKLQSEFISLNSQFIKD